jgi:hypothetical protein
MTTQTLTPRDSDDGPRKDHGGSRVLPGLRGLPWSVVRVHRTSLWIWTAFVVLVSGFLLVLYASGAAMQPEERSVCGPLAAGDSCGPDLFPLWQLDVVATAIAYLPFVVAVFAGGALIGRELESGTDGLACTQSVTPMRWLAAQLAVPALLITAGTALITGLFRWVWLSSDRSRVGDWFESDLFHATGVVSPAYVLLGLAVGALAGILARRTLPGMGLALVFILVVHAAGNTLRFVLWPKTVLTGDQATDIPANARPFGSFESVSFNTPSAERHCGSLEPPALEGCLHHYGGTLERSADIVPASQYWPMQFAESGIVLTIAALAVTAVFFLLRRRMP